VELFVFYSFLINLYFVVKTFKAARVAFLFISHFFNARYELYTGKNYSTARFNFGNHNGSIPIDKYRRVIL